MRRRILGHKKNGIPTGNLVLYNRFDNNLTDETGNHTLNSSGISYTNGIYSGVANEAVLFNASTDYVEVPDSDLLSFGDGSSDSPFSISVAVNFSASSGDSIDMIINKRGDAATSNANVNREWQLSRQVSTGYLQFILFDDSAGAILYMLGSTSLLNSTNYHITATYDGSGLASGMNIYIDGIAESLTDNSAGTYTAMENLSSPVILGSPAWVYTSTPTLANEFLGEMDELGIWNKELSQAEVTAIYNKISAGNSLL